MYFVGIDTTSIKGCLLYSPVKHDVYVSTHVVLHQNHRYDGSYTERHTFDMVTNSDIPTHNLEQNMYLEGTNHLDTDNELL